MIVVAAFQSNSSIIRSSSSSLFRFSCTFGISDETAGVAAGFGAAGISAFPMAGRIAAKMANEEDPNNFILMHAMGANTAGQLGSVIAGGILLSVVSKMLGI